jgi:hypothetical protein
MDSKDINTDSFSRNIKSKVKNIQNPNFKGYLKRQSENRTFLNTIGKPVDPSFLRDKCNKFKTDETHDVSNCKACINLNYILWKKIHFKDGFGASFCDCCIDFPGPTERHLKKKEFASIIKAYSDGEYEGDEEVNNEFIEDVEDDYVKLGDYL